MIKQAVQVKVVKAVKVRNIETQETHFHPKLG